MEQSSDRLFVYGTLMSEFINPASIRLRAETRFLGIATVEGHLFDLKGYPGAIHDPDIDKMVHGELYELRDGTGSFLWLDEYEDGGTGHNPDYLYKRIQVPVIIGKRRIFTWMYQYNRSTRDLPKILSGKYREEELIIKNEKLKPGGEGSACRQTGER
jgi:gamma-glutamylcyclotransferase (GGCT)/AIG2-like uncharacterized protein YtfP